MNGTDDMMRPRIRSKNPEQQQRASRTQHLDADSLRFCFRFAEGPAWRARLAWRRALKHDTSSSPCEQIRVIFDVVKAETTGASREEDHRHGYFRQALAIARHVRRRLEMEARILARQSDADIAASMGIDVEVVTSYVLSFCDVRDSLHATRYIADHFFHAADAKGDYLRRFVLQVAYTGGIYAAEHVLSRIDYLGQEHDLTTAEGRVRERIEIQSQAHIHLGLMSSLSLKHIAELDRLDKEAPVRRLKIGEAISNRTFAALQALRDDQQVDRPRHVDQATRCNDAKRSA